MERFFGKRDDAGIRELLGDELNDVLDFNSIKTDYTKAYIIFKVNRLTDEVTYLEYRKEIAVSADASFKNGFSTNTRLQNAKRRKVRRRSKASPKHRSGSASLKGLSRRSAA